MKKKTVAGIEVTPDSNNQDAKWLDELKAAGVPVVETALKV